MKAIFFIIVFSSCSHIDEISSISVDEPEFLTPLKGLYLEGPYIGSTGPCEITGDRLKVEFRKLDTGYPEIGSAEYNNWIQACDPIEESKSIWKLDCDWRTWNSWPWPVPWNWNYSTLYLDKYPDSQYIGTFTFIIDASCTEDKDGNPCKWPDEPYYTCEQSFLIDQYTAVY